MFYPFKPGRRPRPVNSDPVTDQLAGRIVNESLRLQRRCADFLNAKTRKLPAKSLKTILITVTIAAGSYSLFLIVSGFWGKPPESVLPRAKMLILAPDQAAASRQRKQQAFEAYLDSLEKAFIRDSINSIQP